MRNFLNKIYQYILNFANGDIRADFTPPLSKCYKNRYFSNKTKVATRQKHAGMPV